MADIKSLTLAQDMSSVIDISSTSVNASVVLETDPLKKYSMDESRTVRPLPIPYLPERTYELEENFPCCYKPLEYFVLDRLPFIKWLKRYKPRTLVSDMIAGLTVGLMVVPQALAYASIAGLPLEYGLFSSFMGVFVYAFFGTSKDITLGPTAILSLLTANLINSEQHVGDAQKLNVPLAILLTLLSGIVQIILGIFNLGFLIDFISLPVISGFTSAAAITIAMGQVKHLFGIPSKFVRRRFIYAVYDTIRHLPKTKPWDLALGVFCIALVLFLKYFKTHNDKYENKHPDMHIIQKVIHKFLWMVCTARNAVVVLVAGMICLGVKGYYGEHYPHLPITPVDYNEGSLPSFHLPPFSWKNIKIIGVGIIVAPLIGFLESIAIAKAFARKNKYSINPTQELLALGMANVVSSFIGSYPVTGSFSRTAVNSQSGVKTPAAGFFTGGVVLLAIGVLSQAFDYIPKTALAAIIIAAVLYMVDVKILWTIFKIKKIDDLSLLVSFFGTLIFGIEYGVPMAIALCIIILLYRHSRTRHKVERDGSCLILTFNGGWTFPGVEFVWKRVRMELESYKLQENGESGNRIRAVLFKCKYMSEIDFTIVQALSEGCAELDDSGIQVIIVGAQPQVQEVLDKASIPNIRFSPSISFAKQMIEGLS